MTEDFITATDIKDVLIIKRPTFADDRGFFREIFRLADLESRLGFSFSPLQANHSRSTKDTLRGIHIAPWHKLVTVAHGQVQQVIVDCRSDSPTLGRYVSVTMGEGENNAVFVPAGCGNAFLVTSAEADYIYLASDYWAAGMEKYLAYNDPKVAIAWQSDQPVLSDKDKANPTWDGLFS